MTFPHVFLAILVLGWVGRVAAEIGIGDSRDAVLQQAGAPTSHATRGNREILLYPHGGRVELIDGKVAEVKGPLPTPPATAAAAPAGSTAMDTATTAGAPPAATANRTAPAPKPSNDDAPPEAAMPNMADAANALSRSVEKMDTAWGQRPPLPVASERINWPKLLVSIVLQFGITLLALKLAFKIEEMDALWTGTLAIAGIDAATYAALEALGPATGGLSANGALESGIGALVMVFTIQRFCFTKKLQYAVVTAMSVKLIVRLCHMFVFVLLLHALFG